MPFKKGSQKPKGSGIKKGDKHPLSKKTMREIAEQIVNGNEDKFQEIVNKLMKRSPFKAGLFILKLAEFGYGKAGQFDPSTGETIQNQVVIMMPDNGRK